MAFSSAYCHALPPANTTLQRFDARFWSVDFPLSAIATVIADQPENLTVYAEYRSNRDLVGLLWKSKDVFGHPVLQYIEDQNYAGCRLAFVSNPPLPYNFNLTFQGIGGALIYRLYPYKIEGASLVPAAADTGINGFGPGVTYAVADIFPDGAPALPDLRHHYFIVPFDDLRRGFNFDGELIAPLNIRELFLSVTPPAYGLGHLAKARNVGILYPSEFGEGTVMLRDDSLATIDSVYIDNVTPNLRLSRGDVITINVSLPSKPNVGGKSVYYELEARDIDIPVLYGWEGDGTTTRRIFLKEPIKDIAWGGGKADATKLHKDTPLGSVPVELHIWNMSVTGSRTTVPRRFYPQPVHQMGMTSGYDDTYNITPWRQMDNTWNLGYRGFFTMYMGMSHYFKAFSTGGYSDFQNRVVKDAAQPLNTPTVKWCESLFSIMETLGYTFVWSTSYEILNSYCPEEWAQKDYQQKNGLSGWSPPSAFVIPTHREANGPIDYLARVIKHGLSLMRAAGWTEAECHFQIGEPWWWDGSYSNGAPAIYDPYTRSKYTAQTGQPVPTPFITDYREADLEPHMPYLLWLGEELGLSTNYIRDSVKAAYPASKATLLFFSPQLFDNAAQHSPGLPPAEVEGQGLRAIINFPINYWKYPNYDFMQIEDYDWIINGELDKLPLTIAAATDPEQLNYPLEVVHYFVGFVLLPQHTWIWPSINIATREAKRANVPYIYIWAYPQVIRDGILYDDTIIETDFAAMPEMPRRRQLDAVIEDRLVVPAFFAKVGDDAYMNSTDRNITWDGQLWYGVGKLGRLMPLTEGATSTEAGWSMSLAGIPTTDVIGTAESLRAKRVTMLLALLDKDLNVVQEPRVIGSGEIFNTAIAVEERIASINLSVRSRLANWRKTISSRYTDEAQRKLHPGDEGFKFIADLHRNPLKWGNTTPGV